MGKKVEKDLRKIGNCRAQNSKYFCQLIRSSKGFTLIEIMIVVVLSGAIMGLGYQLLQSFVSSSFSENTALQIKQLFRFGRAKAIETGSILSLSIDLKEREMGLRYYDPKLEYEQDATIESLAHEKAQDSYRFKRILEKKEELKDSKEADAEIDGEDIVPDEWILGPSSLPSDLKTLYSVSGIKLSNSKTYIHFYPNGTSDSLIIEFDNDLNKYLYLPRYNLPSVYLKNIDFEEEK